MSEEAIMNQYELNADHNRHTPLKHTLVSSVPRSDEMVCQDIYIIDDKITYAEPLLLDTDYLLINQL